MGIVKRIYAWWMSGYSKEYLEETARTKAEPKEKNPLGQRIRDWWHEGYIFDEEPLETESNTLEEQFYIKKLGGLSVEIPSHTLEKTIEKSFLTSNSPSKEDLDALKKALNIEKGCLQYKKNGNKVYQVIYDPETKKRNWTSIGSWGDLKTRIPQEASP